VRAFTALIALAYKIAVEKRLAAARLEVKRSGGELARAGKLEDSQGVYTINSQMRILFPQFIVF
jgi:hypothetical protein